MIRGNMFDVFAVRFADGQEISMIAKDEDKARALANAFFLKKEIIKVWHVTSENYDN